MTTGQIVGIAFVFAALVDLGVAFLLVGPRVPDEGRRQVVQIALTLGAVTLLILGIAFLAGALGVGAVPSLQS